MSSDQSSLYGKSRSKTTKTQEISSSSNLAFTSQLSSLINNTSAKIAHGRPRPSKAAKSDIFSKHNKGASKRAAADLQDDDRHVFNQVHRQSGDLGTIDEATLNRSKQRMMKKARLYEDMKKGVHLVNGDSDDDEDDGGDDYISRLRRKEKAGLVDFDTKWADEQRKKADRHGEGEEEEEEGENDGDDDDENASVISFEDEFGRTRHGTRAEAAHAARIRDEEENRGRVATTERWRPSRPDHLIFGETIQTHAFNPDANIAAEMARLAAQRDRSPEIENTHYDADAEVRNRGTGFYAFSQDEEERKKQMAQLEESRMETQRRRDLLLRRAAEREAVVQERRRQIQELRARRLSEMTSAEMASTESAAGDV
ncbi:Uncharacterized protein PECH_008765 [Penicillium ucsense]|uniref:Uncharacterized protein n=1 Tax=Penicillium ucsense TaxID=2839758 RepID=A0A8J8WIM7_9EURO|nr:Uncharacterized protein PECM_008378 [Penicillium ucsense]KAF7733974.1 Uncharacterized protein PECH_008765 [Penicillium ucsense]